MQFTEILMVFVLALSKKGPKIVLQTTKLSKSLQGVAYNNG